MSEQQESYTVNHDLIEVAPGKYVRRQPEQCIADLRAENRELAEKERGAVKEIARLTAEVAELQQEWQEGTEVVASLTQEVYEHEQTIAGLVELAIDQNDSLEHFRKAHDALFRDMAEAYSQSEEVRERMPDIVALDIPPKARLGEYRGLATPALIARLAKLEAVAKEAQTLIDETTYWGDAFYTSLDIALDELNRSEVQE